MNAAQLIDELIREREGGYVNDAADHGGATKFGITIKTLSDWLGHAASAGDVQALTREDAHRLYTELYLEAPGFERIEDPQLRRLVFDCGVLHGTGRAARWLQEAAGVTVDGQVGPKTAAAAAAAPLKVYVRLCAKRQRFIGEIVAADATQLKFLKGWSNRCSSFLDQLEI